jgi:hypothetical protein
LKESDEPIPTEVMKIIQRCWSATIEVRPTFEEIEKYFRMMK